MPCNQLAIANFTLFLLFVSFHAAAGEQMNVLFLAIDDLRPALGCYGDEFAVTPNIDRLARRGVVFENAFCQQAVCSPSRLSVLTGLRPDTIRVWDLKTHFRPVVPEVVTLPQFFKNCGYHTQSIGKIYHGNGKPSKDPPSWSVAPQLDHVREPKLRYALPQNLAGEGLKRAASESADVDDSHYTDGVVCDAALEALRQLSSEQSPFFLAVGFRKPHLPFCAPKKYWDLYARTGIPLPSTNQFPKDAPELATRSWRELEGYTDIPNENPAANASRNVLLSEAKVRELRHGYYACVSYVDALVGRLLDELDSLNMTEKTVIVLWGDHGFHLGEQGIWAKANNYEFSTRVPLIISVPGETKANSSDALVELVDVYPTLAEVCGLDAPASIEGISLKSLLVDPGQPWKQAVFSQYPRARSSHRHIGAGDIMGYAVRTKTHRYVEWRDNKSQRIEARELYDRRSDPEESRNIAQHPEQANTLNHLAATLRGGWRSALPPSHAQMEASARQDK